MIRHFKRPRPETHYYAWNNAVRCMSFYIPIHYKITHVLAALMGMYPGVDLQELEPLPATHIYTRKPNKLTYRHILIPRLDLRGQRDRTTASNCSQQKTSALNTIRIELSLNVLNKLQRCTPLVSQAHLQLDTQSLWIWISASGPFACDSHVAPLWRNCTWSNRPGFHHMLGRTLWILSQICGKPLALPPSDKGRITKVDNTKTSNIIWRYPHPHPLVGSWLKNSNRVVPVACHC